MKLLHCLLLTVAALSSTAPGALHAQAAAFPTKTVTLVVPYTANSGSDIIARVLGPRLSARWGQPVIVDNKPGASGNLGANRVAKAPPDGYTLLMMINSLTMTPSLHKSVPFDLVSVPARARRTPVRPTSSARSSRATCRVGERSSRTPASRLKTEPRDRRSPVATRPTSNHMST